ncbi:MAG: hypothetical protein QM775_28365 [Pirellulales bacterium]
MKAEMPRKTIISNEVLLISLACGSTIEAAASKAGLNKRTVHRRLEDPVFRQRLQEFRTSMVERASSMLGAAAMEAVKTLLSLMERSIPHATRLGAARAILEVGIKMRDLIEVEQRLTALENSLKSNTARNRLNR